ncbi:hypothetical protein K461DRAFT_283340 [Myriangium duriaei CBS 260.36]|uniref:Uncharacterized protein n=1 Tax=Myriangium duriaei CBS 260.36 TaxID=1168546 RepID=A0A9P4ISL8_9PEZI|nr:hypothetical protein K461DRAFT_283340 [Myriangium duriaei CBS 260.36]
MFLQQPSHIYQCSPSRISQQAASTTAQRRSNLGERGTPDHNVIFNDPSKPYHRQDPWSTFQPVHKSHVDPDLTDRPINTSDPLHDPTRNWYQGMSARQIGKRPRIEPDVGQQKWSVSQLYGLDSTRSFPKKPSRYDYSTDEYWREEAQGG